MNLEDIARKAGVSRSTVSRVINNDRYVSAGVRERVMRVIEEENFQPNPAARTLVTRRTEIIGVVIPTTENVFFTDNSYFPMLLAGLGGAAARRNYALLLWLGELTNKDEHWIRKIVNSRQVDGLVIASLTHDHPLFPRLLDVRMPLVMIDRPMQHDDRLSYVTIDNVHAAENVVKHLIATGRKRIAHITGQMEISDGRDRLLGYQNALKQAGIPVESDLIYYGKFTRTAGYLGMKYLAQFAPDAIFAGGDTVAVGVLHAAHELGLRVPQDLSVVGFDDIDVARQALPQLTTMRQPVQLKGATAADLLIDLIEGKVTSPQHITLPTELVIRNSCGAVLQPAQLTANPHYFQPIKGGDA
jgi:DNA-binding LacI/PurR family transcriptional regulator